MSSLRDSLREHRAALLARLQNAGPAGQPSPCPRAPQLFDELVATLGDTGDRASSPLPLGPSAAVSGERAVAFSALGRAVFEGVERGELHATVAELGRVHRWVSSGLGESVELLARERAATLSKEATLRGVFATAGIVVVEVDTELRFRWTYDFSRPPFVGEQVMESTTSGGEPADVGEMVTTLRRVLDTGVGTRSEVTITPRDGGEALNLLVALEPTRDEAGAIVGVVGASTDITELKSVQSELAQSLGFREKVMAILAHDLRNPLSTVAALSALFARRETLPDDVRTGLVHVERAAKRMDELIGTLLDFSAVRFGGTLPITPAGGDLHEVTRAVVDELREALPERSITLDARGDTGCRLDSARMAQVVSNLTSNALTHGAADQPVSVTIDGSAEGLILSVGNRGKAIPAELVPLLFEPFRRGDGAEAGVRGLGLGLYIAKEIVVAHGGTIEVASTAEHETVFTVRLPRAHA